MAVRLGASKTDSLTMEAHRDLGRLAHESAFEQQAGAEPQSRSPPNPRVLGYLLCILKVTPGVTPTASGADCQMKQRKEQREDWLHQNV